MKINLTRKDIQLISFLGKYKIMLAVDSKKIYNSKSYYLKRLKVLQKEGYIKRDKYYYIKLDIKGKELVKKLGYRYNENCRNKEYKERIKNISKIATITINSNAEFIPSWELKNKDIYTETARRYIGEGRYKNKKYLVYYIDKTRDFMYERQIIGDIKKTAYYKDIVIFLDSLNRLNKKNYYFMLGKDNIYIINDNKHSLEYIDKLINIDFYEILSNLYKKELLLSSWLEADYMIDNGKFIIIMPFINVEKLHRINIIFRNDKNHNKEIDLITLSENTDKIKEILKRKCNILEIEKLMEERMKYLKSKGVIPLFFLITYIFLTPIISCYYNRLNSVIKFTDTSFKTENLFKIWKYSLCNTYILFTWFLLSIIIIAIYKLVKITMKNLHIENEGVKYKKKDGTFGTADWANEEEIQEYLSFNKRDGIILGESENKEIITLPIDTYLNKNIAVFGASGSGKSAGFALPNGIELVQESLKKDMSLVFTDPKRRAIS